MPPGAEACVKPSNPKHIPRECGKVWSNEFGLHNGRFHRHIELPAGRRPWQIAPQPLGRRLALMIGDGGSSVEFAAAASACCVRVRDERASWHADVIVGKKDQSVFDALQ